MESRNGFGINQSIVYNHNIEKKTALGIGQLKTKSNCHFTSIVKARKKQEDIMFFQSPEVNKTTLISPSFLIDVP
jgi:hypothetical protein